MESETKANGIDFEPITKEAQEYVLAMKKIVDKQEMSEEEYSDILGHRISLADSFCYLMFGKKFDEIRKKYMEFVNKQIESTGDEIETLREELNKKVDEEVQRRVAEQMD